MHDQSLERILGQLRGTTNPHDIPAAPGKGELAELVGPAARQQGIVRAGGEPESISSAQRHIWVRQLLAGDSGVHNRVFSVRLRGALDFIALQEALRDLERRHRALRTRFAFRDGALTSTVDDPADRPLPIRHIDLASEPDVRQAIVEFGWAAIDIATGPPWRYLLLRQHRASHLLLVACHDIAADEYSIQLLLGQLALGYTARVRTGLPVGRATDDSTVAPPAAAADLPFWSTMLAGAPAPVLLPGQLANHDDRDFTAWWRDLEFDGVHLQSLRAHVALRNATLSTALLSCVVRACADRADTDDVVLGVPLSRRGVDVPHAAIGTFASTLPVRFRLSDPGSPLRCLRDVSATMLGLAAHCRVDPAAVARMVPARPGASVPYHCEFGWYETDVAASAFPGLDSRCTPEFCGCAEPGIAVRLGVRGDRIRGMLRGRRVSCGDADVSAFAATLAGCVLDLQAVAGGNDHPVRR